LFLRYLFERSGGAQLNKSGDGFISQPGIKFIRSLINSKNAGFSNLASIFNDVNQTNYSIKDLLSDFYTTLVVSGNKNIANPKYMFKKPYQDPISHNSIGVALQTQVADFYNRIIKLKGPDIELLTKSHKANIAGFGVNFYKISVPESNGQSQLVKLKADKQSEISLLVVAAD